MTVTLGDDDAEDSEARVHTSAFKEPAIKRVKDGKTVGVVAKEMGLVEQTRIHRGVRQPQALALHPRVHLTGSVPERLDQHPAGRKTGRISTLPWMTKNRGNLTQVAGAHHQIQQVGFAIGDIRGLLDRSMVVAEQR